MELQNGSLLPKGLGTSCLKHRYPDCESKAEHMDIADFEDVEGFSNASLAGRLHSCTE